MYAKVFTQIFDSSISEDYQTRHVFEDFLKLADVDGVVDMTAEAISRRTNAPLELITDGIKKLEAPDPLSRSKEEEGRRIVLIDPDRDWGWRIVNYLHYRNLRDEEARRSYYRNYMKEYRDKKSKTSAKPQMLNSVKLGKHLSTKGEGEGEVKEEVLTPQPPISPSAGDGHRNGKWNPCPIQKRLNRLFHRRDSTPWSSKELKAFKAIDTHEPDDLAALESYYTASLPQGKDFRRRDLCTLLNNFQGELDRARNFTPPNSF